MRAPVIDLLALLVRIPSPSGRDGEVRCLEEVARHFADEPAASAVLHRDVTGRTTCLTVTAAVPDDRPVLLFSAHIDVVPVTDPGAWTHDPFGAVIADGRLHGRGSSDMKSGLAAAMVVVRALLAAGAPVALAVSRSEEVGCRGAADVAAALDGIPVGAVIVPESTSNEVVLGHRGALWLSVATAGRAAHGSTPERGDNAVLAMARVLTGSDRSARTPSSGGRRGASAPSRAAPCRTSSRTRAASRSTTDSPSRGRRT
jgi:succinyl-diaminopimelate desuccinylase